MTKHVILIDSEQTLPAPGLLEALREAGFEAVVTPVPAPAPPSDRIHFEPAPRRMDGVEPLAVLCEVAVPTHTAATRELVKRAAAAWPTVPVIACRQCCNGAAASTESPSPKPDVVSLRRLGFTAVLDDPAQLLGLLRELAEQGDFADQSAPGDETEFTPPSLLLPHSLTADALRHAFEMMASLHFADSQKGAAQAVLSGLAPLVHANRWAIFLTSEGRTVDELSFDLLAARGQFNSEPAAELASTRPTGNLLHTRPISSVDAADASNTVRSAAATAEALQMRESNQHILAVPLVWGEKVIAVLEATRGGDAAASLRDFTATESALVSALAVPLAAALSNAVRIAEAERLSQIDDLTKLHNARFLRQFLTAEIKRARRYGSSVAALFLDLDDFKKVNDVHGHLVGSHVLMELATGILSAVRDTDVVARYGGDEFVVILPETGMEQALRVAERIRSHTAAHTFTGGRRLRLRLTASFGVAAFPEHAQSPQQLIAAADKAMYAAKAARKNCIHAAIR